MTFGLVVAFALLEFEGSDLLTLELADDFGFDGSTREGWSTDFQFSAFASRQNLVERCGFTLSYFELLDVELVAHGDFVLLAAGFDDCVCHKL